MIDSINYMDLNASDFSNKEALVDSRCRLTFSQAKQKADRLALAFIEMEISRGKVIVSQLPNVVEDFIIRYALPKAGLVGCYLMMNMRHEQIRFAINSTEATGIIIVAKSRGFDFYQMIRDIRPSCPSLKYIFVVGDHVPKGASSITKLMDSPMKEEHAIEQLEEITIKANELITLKMTSGTTGKPKLVATTAPTSSVSRNIESAKRHKVTSDDVFGAFAPLGGGGSGPPCRFNAQSKGCKVALLETFDAEKALELIQREKITFATGVPAQLSMMVRNQNLSKYDLSSLRAFYYAGAKLPYSVAREVEDMMGCVIIAHYGAMDVHFSCTTSVDDPTEVRRNSVGKPLQTDVQFQLINEQGKKVNQGETGELVVKESGAGFTYYNDTDTANKKYDSNGWYHTGDLVRLDEQGNFYIVGRKKDMINRGGQNIYPAEIEGILITHPKVINVAIVGMPDPIMGEKACAYIVSDHNQSITLNEIVSFLLEKQIPKYKLPERLEIVDNFPMSGDGQKVLKRVLVEKITAQLKAEKLIH